MAKPELQTLHEVNEQRPMFIYDWHREQAAAANQNLLASFFDSMHYNSALTEMFQPQPAAMQFPASSFNAAAHPTISAVPSRVAPVYSPSPQSSVDDLSSKTKPRYSFPSMERPPVDYKTLVLMALKDSAKHGGMTICEIYDYVQQAFPYYGSEHAPNGWRSRIRNVLTVNGCFQRIPDPNGGRKGKWVLVQSNDIQSPTNSIASVEVVKEGKLSKIRRSISALMARNSSQYSSQENHLGKASMSTTDICDGLDDDDYSGVKRRASILSLRTLLFAESRRPSANNQQQDLVLNCLSRKPSLSASSMEHIDRLAQELKLECSMAARRRTEAGTTM